MKIKINEALKGAKGNTWENDPYLTGDLDKRREKAELALFKEFSKAKTAPKEIKNEAVRKRFEAFLKRSK
jgi:hypothetical protein